MEKSFSEINDAPAEPSPTFVDYSDNRLLSLKRIIEAASGASGQAQICKSLLLSLFDPFTFSFKLADLRRLDASLLNAALVVIWMDSMHRDLEIHERLPDFEPLFRRWSIEQACTQPREP